MHGAISKNTDYLVVGRGSGEKFNKAQALGVKILPEKDFSDMLG